MTRTLRIAISCIGAMVMVAPPMGAQEMTLQVVMARAAAYVADFKRQFSGLVAEEQYLPAIRVLSGIIAAAPGDARAHYYLGRAYAGVGLCGAASIHLEEAARLAPEYRRLPAGPGLACRNAASLGITGPVRSRGQD